MITSVPRSSCKVPVNFVGF